MDRFLRRAGGGGLRFDRRQARLQRSQALLELVLEPQHSVSQDALEAAFELTTNGGSVGV